MKIKKNTDHTLIVEDAPWLFGFMIIVFILLFSAIGVGLMLSGEWMGIIFFLFGAGIAPAIGYFIIRRVQVVFYRPGGWVEIRRANLRRTGKTRYDIGEVKRAVVETTSGDNGDLYRVTLIVEKAGVQGDLPLTQAYSNVGKHHQVARAINAWLGVPDNG